MKKIISSVIVCVMLLGLVVPCSFASEQSAYGDKVIFYSPNVKANSGEDFVLDVNVRDNPGICAYSVLLEYDTALFDVTSKVENERCIIEKSIINGIYASNEQYDKNVVWVMTVGSNNVFEDGKLFGFRFTVKADAPQTVSKIKVIVSELVHVDDNGGTYDVFDLFDGKGASYEAIVSVNSNEEIAEVSEAEFKCLTEEEFAATYEERLEALQTPKPTPKPIYATPRPEKNDNNDGGAESTGSTLKTVEVVLNEDVSDYMAPVSESAFEPDRSATRYEIVAALDKIFTVKNAEDKDEFADVSEEYKKAVNEFAQAGIINGYEDKTFGGEKNITRAEFVKLLTTAFKIDYTVSADSELNDIGGHWAEKYIKAFVNSGYIVGYPDGSFKTDANITRAEAVTVINRVLGIKSISDAEVKFADLDKNHWAYDIIMATFK